MLDINQIFGREVFPPSMIIPKLNITGKGVIIPFLQQQEQQAAAMQQEQQHVQHAFEHAKLQELMSKATANIAMAKERVGRYDANVGLLEERLSEISKNQSLSTKAKMEALEKMVDVIHKFGETEAMLKLNDIRSINDEETLKEDEQREKAKSSSEGTEFLNKLMGQMPPPQQNNASQNPMQNQQEML